MNYFFLLLGIGLAYLLYKVIAEVIWHAQNRSKAKQLGCKPLPQYPSDILGIGPTYKLLKSNDDGVLPNHFKERFDHISKQENRKVMTFEAQFLRTPVFNTKDPKIIQTLLATQFKDFELSPIRYSAFSPL